MPNTQIQYVLQAQSSLAATVKADADAMKTLASSAALTHKELVAGMNASTRAAAEFRKELGQLGTTSKSTGADHQSLLTSIAGGVAIGNLATQAITAIGHAALDMGKNVLDAAGDFEQSKISFTTFLGSAPAMKTFLTDLQAFANVSPFQFGDLQTDAKYLLAMGTAGQDVLPILKDVSAAVAASGGGADALANVSAAYAKINAEGKTSAIYLNELTRNGVPAFDMLSEALGVSVAKVRELASEGAITAQVFDQAFHTYTVEHYGDMLAQQSRTLKGLESTIEDVGGQFERALGGPIIAAIEPELAKLTDELTKPEVADTLATWGDNLGKAAFAATQLWDNVSAGARAAFSVVQPIFDAMGQLLGSLPDAPTMPDPVAPVAKSTDDLNSKIDLTVAKTHDYKEEIEAAQDRLTAIRRGQQDASYLTDQAIQQERNKLSVLEEQWAVQDRTTSISRLQQKIAKDTLLAKDIYSSAGQSAAKRLVDEKQQLEDMQVAAGREGQKRQLNDKISGLEAQKKVQDHAAQQAERGIQDEITGYQRRAAAEKKAADDAAKAREEADAAAKAAAKAAAQLARDQDILFAKLQLLDYGTTTSTDSTRGLGGAFDFLNERIKQYAPLQDAANEAQRTWQTLMAGAPKEMDDTTQAVKQLTQALGLDKGAAWAIQGAKDGWNLFLDSLIIGAPVLINEVGSKIHAFTDDVKLLADNAQIGAIMLKGMLGGNIDTKALADAGAQLQRDQAAADARRKADQQALVDSAASAAQRETKQLLTDTAGSRQMMSDILAGRSNPTNDDSGITSGGGFGTGAFQPRHRAGGGPVYTGQPYIVGDGPPEVFVPQTNGAIMPYNGGGGEMTVHIEALCPDCHQRRIEQTIRRQGSQLMARHVMGAMG